MAPEAKGNHKQAPAELTQILAPVVSENGLMLLETELTKAGKYSTLRVIVDLPEGPGDVDLDTIEQVARQISDALDEADPIKGSYQLEVSSAGAERELRDAREFGRAVGHLAQINTEAGEVFGRVLSVNENGVEVETKTGTQLVPFTQITKAQQVVDLSGAL